MHTCNCVASQVSLWASSLILKEVEIQERARVFAKLVDVCKHLRKLHSFNTLLAILSAFNSTAVHRLRRTTDAAGPKTRTTLQRLHALMDHADHYATIRAVLRTTSRSTIPYLGMYLTDVTLVHNGNPDFVDGDKKTLVNFNKCRKLYEIVRAVVQFQREIAKHSEGLLDDEAVSRVLGDLEGMSSETLYELSRHVEPPAPTQEPVA
jgi:Rap guanine nucleotide exchange factor 1